MDCNDFTVVLVGNSFRQNTPIMAVSQELLNTLWICRLMGLVLAIPAMS